MVRYEPYPTLRSGGSRWKGSACPVATPPRNVDRADLAIYIPGLKVSDLDGSDLDVLRAAISDRLSRLREINESYVIPGDADGAAYRTPIYGNEEAAKVFSEIDELIRLARSTFPDPDQLHDWMAQAFGQHFSQALLEEHTNKAATLELALKCTDSWGVARYRFLQHYMRDTPRWWPAAMEPQAKAWGDDANGLIHGASVDTDAEMVMASSIYDKDAETLFQNTYGMTSAEARRLKHYARHTAKLHPQSKDTLVWAQKMVDRVVDWKVELMRAYTRELLGTAAFRQAGAARQRELRAAHYGAVAPALVGAERAYASFVGRVRACLDAAAAAGALPPAAFRALATASRDLARAVAHCPANARVHGPARAHALRQRWPSRGPGDRFSADPPGGRAALEPRHRLLPPGGGPHAHHKRPPRAPPAFGNPQGY